jgi:outer membrane receptor protein involved in Fe transport
VPDVLKRIALSSVIAIALFPAHAEAFTGRVIDRMTGRPIAGAEVAIGGLAGTVKTGADGRFVWSPDPPAPFVALVILPGGRLARPVRVPEYRKGELVLIHVEPAFAETVSISGAAPGVEALAGAMTTIVPGSDIERRSPANLMMALENVPGVSAVAEGQSAVPAIRGLARGRTLLLLDGTRLFSERRAGPSVSVFAPDNLDRIEVVRGPASVAYGSDAFGGVIALVTRRPAAVAPFGARLTASFGAGLPATRIDGELNSHLGPRVSATVQGRHRTAGDYSSPEGVIPNSGWNDSGGLARVSVMAGGWWTASWQGDFGRDIGLPRSDTATLRATTPFERSQRVLVSFDRSSVPGLGHVTATGLVSRYEQRLDQDRLAAPGRPRRIDRADIEATDLEVRAVSRTAIRDVRITGGADVTERRDLHADDIGITFNAAGQLTATTINASIASARRRDTGVFLHAALPAGSRVTLSVGGRVDRVRSHNEGGFFGDRSVSHTAGSGSAAIALRPWSALTITGQLSRGFRDPTLSDRFFRGPVGRGFIVGNPNLGPERSRQIDVTARYSSNRWSAGAAYYHYDISNLIERYQSGTDTFLFRNRGLAEIRGLEVEGAIELFTRTTIEASATVGRGRAQDDGASLDDIAPARVVMQVRQSIGSRTSVSARVAAIRRDTSPGPSEIETPGYTDVGVTASIRVLRQLDLRFAAANLLNHGYYSSPGPRGVLAPRRNAIISAVLKY